MLALLLPFTRRSSPHHENTEPAVASQPLRVGPALQMALLFQVVLYAVSAAQAWFGQAGLFTTAAALGLTDVDALTVTMARSVAPSAGVAIAADAVTVGVVANTLLKAGLALVVGRGACRTLVPAALAAVAAVLVATLWLV